MVKFIAVNMSRMEINKYDLLNVIPERKSFKGIAPTMKGPEMNRCPLRRRKSQLEGTDGHTEGVINGDNEDDNETQDHINIDETSRRASPETLSKRRMATSWRQPRRSPNKEETKKIIALVLKIAVTKILKNHVYQFGDSIFHQQQKGIIGLDLMRAACQIYMYRWSIKVNQLCEQITANSQNEEINVVPEIMKT